jgi:hypothetical protein
VIGETKNSRKTGPAACAALAIAALAVAVGRGQVGAQAKFSTVHRCPPCDAVANSFVRADVSPFGSWAMGSTGGDPLSPDDDDRRLLYGFEPGGQSLLGSSYVTLRVVGPRGTSEVIPDPASAVDQDVTADAVHTTWEFTDPYRVRVVQHLRLAPNPLAGATTSS